MFQYKNHFMSWLLYLYNFMSPFVVYRNSCDALAGFRKQENCLFPWEYKRKLYPKCFKLVPKISVILRPFILDLKTIRGILPGIENIFEYIGCRWNGISIWYICGPLYNFYCQWITQFKLYANLNEKACNVYMKMPVETLISNYHQATGLS